MPLRFCPALPPEARVGTLRVDGAYVHPVLTRGRYDRHLEMDLEVAAGPETVVEADYVYDLAVVVTPPDLEEGSGSRHWRLVDRWWEDQPGGAPPRAHRLFFEGPPGTERTVDLLLPGRPPRGIEGAGLQAPVRKGRGRLLLRFPQGEDSAYTPVGVRITF